MKTFLCQKGNKKLTIMVSLEECQVLKNNFDRGVLDDSRAILMLKDSISKAIEVFKAEQAEAVEVAAVIPGGPGGGVVPGLPAYAFDDHEEVIVDMD